MQAIVRRSGLITVYICYGSQALEHSMLYSDRRRTAACNASRNGRLSGPYPAACESFSCLLFGNTMPCHCRLTANASFPRPGQSLPETPVAS